MKNVLIVEDERMAAEAFCQYIAEVMDRYCLVGTISDAANTELFCMGNKVDLILMDVCTACDSSGLEAAKIVKRRFPAIRVIIVTSAPEYRFIEKEKQAGADSFWYKDASKEELLLVMDWTMEGKKIYPECTPKVTIGYGSSYEFTPKEMEVLYWLVKLISTKAIADQMGITTDTVNDHLRHLKEKTGCKSKAELAILAVGKRLVLPQY